MTFLIWLLILVGQEGPQPKISISELEQRAHDLVNAERVREKLRPLRLDPKLSDIARAHSQDMAKRGFFDHVNPDGKSPADRGRDGGVPCRKRFGQTISLGIGENIFQNNLYRYVIQRGDVTSYVWNSLERIASTTVQGWMDSPGHRDNLLRDRYASAGLGVAISTDDKVYLTQVFC